MENSTNRKNVSLLNELLHIKSTCLWLTLSVVVIHIFGAWFRYDTDHGLVFSGQIVSIMLIMFLAAFIAVSVSSNYTFIATLPVKTSDIHTYMSLTLDLAFIIIAAANAVAFVLFDMAVHIPIRMIPHLVMYILCHIFLYTLTAPGGSKQNPQQLGIFSGFMGFIGYIMGAVSSASTSFFINKYSSYSEDGITAIAIILGALSAAAVITRILSNKGIRSKLRLIKIYKKKKKSDKAVSYV